MIMILKKMYMTRITHTSYNDNTLLLYPNVYERRNLERYKTKVDKQERMATLHHLVPRELFVREDRYLQELEHVYKWSGISDQEIAEIYQTKLKKSGIKQHGASTMMNNYPNTNKDPHAGFRDVPNFLDPTNGKGSNGHYSTSNSSSSSSINDVTRSLAIHATHLALW